MHSSNGPYSRGQHIILREKSCFLKATYSGNQRHYFHFKSMCNVVPTKSYFDASDGFNAVLLKQTFLLMEQIIVVKL